MITLVTAALAICLLIAGCRFLDRTQAHSSVRALVRKHLIRFYVFLYDYPKRVWRGSERSYSEDTIWNSSPQRGSKTGWLKGIGGLLFILLCGFGGGSLAEAIFKESADFPFIT